jgi:acetamidase/formamidase
VPSTKARAIFIGNITDQGLAGTATDLSGNQWTWVATRRPSLSGYTPRTHNYEPETFVSLLGSGPPALRINSGDTVRTWTLGASGLDRDGKRRSIAATLTGPFFVEDAFPGDTLAIKLNRIRVNASFGASHGFFQPSTVTPAYYDTFPRDKQMVHWRIDHHRNVAVLSDPSEKLKGFSVPLRPMLGTIGVAPDGGQAVGGNAFGAYGGNLDYNRITEGVTVYFRVHTRGALLIFGDGHAAQGDGEISGAGIESPLEVEFTVNVIRGNQITSPRIETPDEFIAVGTAGDLERAMQAAITALAQWVADEYGLSPSDTAIVLDQGIQLDIAEVVTPLRAVGARISKKLLETIPK